MTMQETENKKKDLCYFLVCSENIIFAAGNVALSLNKYMPYKNFDIVVYHTGLKKNNEDALNKIKNVKLKYFQFDRSFSDYMLSEKGLNSNGRWKDVNSLLTYAHFEIFDLLKLYHRVIWLDVDMSIQDDISDLENYAPLGLAKDYDFNRCWSVGDQFLQPVKDFDMTRDSHINCCVVVSDQLPHYKELTSWCYAEAIKYANVVKNCDQAIFQIMFQTFNFVPKELPFNLFSCHARMEMANLAKIVHFGFIDKVWNNQAYLQCFPEWFRTHVKWLELGGDDFDRSNLSLKSIWSELFDKPHVEYYSSLEQSKDNVQSDEILQLPHLYEKRNLYLFGIRLVSRKISNDSLSVKILGIPFIYLKKTRNRRVIRLFWCIELFKYNNIDNLKKIFIFGLPFITKKKYSYKSLH